MPRRLLIAACATALAISLFALFIKKSDVPFQGGGADPNFSEADARSRASLGLNEDGRQEGETEDGPGQSGFLSFPHRDELNPTAEKTFIVAFRFVFSSQLLRIERRIHLLSKYQHDAVAPFPGWVIALRLTRTSVRPEVYWQTSGGKGGWFTFDRFDLKPNHAYDVTLIAKPGQQMSAFLQAADPEAEGSASASAANDGFLGGYPLQGIGIPRSTLPLTFSASANDASVSRIVVAQVPSLRMSRIALSRLVKDGPDAIKQKLAPADIVLDYPPAQPEPPETK